MFPIENIFMTVPTLTEIVTTIFWTFQIIGNYLLITSPRSQKIHTCAFTLTFNIRKVWNIICTFRMNTIFSWASSLFTTNTRQNIPKTEICTAFDCCRRRSHHKAQLSPTVQLTTLKHEATTLFSDNPQNKGQERRNVYCWLFVVKLLRFEHGAWLAYARYVLTS